MRHLKQCQRDGGALINGHSSPSLELHRRVLVKRITQLEACHLPQYKTERHLCLCEGFSLQNPPNLFGMLTIDDFFFQRGNVTIHIDLEDLATGWPRQLGRLKKCPNLRH